MTTDTDITRPEDCICDFWKRKHRVYCPSSIRELKEYQTRRKEMEEEFYRACKDNWGRYVAGVNDVYIEPDWDWET